MKQEKQPHLRQPTIKELARLTAILGGHSLPENFNLLALTQWKPPVGDARNLWLICQEVIEEMPAQDRAGLEIEELATITVLMAHGRNIIADNRLRLVHAAIKLWRRCADSVADFPKLLAVAEAAAQVAKSIPDPGGYPVPLKKALRLWLPRKRLPERMRLLREFISEAMRRNSFVEEVILDHVEAYIKHWLKHGMSEDYYQHYSRHFTSWVTDYAARQRKIRARKGGEAKARRAKNIQ